MAYNPTGAAAIAIQEVDGSPSLSGITSLVVTNGSLSSSTGTANQAVIVTGGSTASSVALITDTLLSTAQATISFSGITTGYKDLWLLVQARGDSTNTNVALQMRFNTDTGANYDYQQVQFASTAVNVSAAAATSLIRLGAVSAGGAPTGSAGSYFAHIPNYASTVFHKQATPHGFARFDTASYLVESNGGNWRNAAGVSQIDLTLSAGNFASGSRATLLGVG